MEIFGARIKGKHVREIFILTPTFDMGEPTNIRESETTHTAQELGPRAKKIERDPGGI